MPRTSRRTSRQSKRHGRRSTRGVASRYPRFYRSFLKSAVEAAEDAKSRQVHIQESWIPPALLSSVLHVLEQTQGPSPETSWSRLHDIEDLSVSDEVKHCHMLIGLATRHPQETELVLASGSHEHDAVEYEVAPRTEPLHEHAADDRHKPLIWKFSNFSDGSYTLAEKETISLNFGEYKRERIIEFLVALQFLWWHHKSPVDQQQHNEWRRRQDDGLWMRYETVPKRWLGVNTLFDKSFDEQNYTTFMEKVFTPLFGANAYITSEQIRSYARLEFKKERFEYEDGQHESLTIHGIDPSLQQEEFQFEQLSVFQPQLSRA
jgi:hypothetical protein